MPSSAPSSHLKTVAAGRFWSGDEAAFDEPFHSYVAAQFAKLPASADAATARGSTLWGASFCRQSLGRPRLLAETVTP